MSFSQRSSGRVLGPGGFGKEELWRGFGKEDAGNWTFAWMKVSFFSFLLPLFFLPPAPPGPPSNFPLHLDGRMRLAPRSGRVPERFVGLAHSEPRSECVWQRDALAKEHQKVDCLVCMQPSGFDSDTAEMVLPPGELTINNWK